MPLSTLKVPSNIGPFLLFASIREMRFFLFFGSKNAQKFSKMPPSLVLFDFRQLLLYDLPQKNVSKYPKIAIFKFANITIFEIGLL